ncbi:MAG: nucleotidyltransferase domain-containing protein [candidate division WOR-3 bacterium]
MEGLDKILRKIKKNKNVVAIYLFGSYAKKESNPLSDIDICVILKNPNEKDEYEIGSMYSQKLDLVLFHRLPLHIQFEVFKFGKELYVKDEEILSEIKFKVLRDFHERVRSFKMIRESILNED